ncbi:MAG: SCO family protein [Lysobacteraceae bacterium]|nr:MAG: SCO family protein [Xanthomonadaceae bacterium]
MHPFTRSRGSARLTVLGILVTALAAGFGFWLSQRITTPGPAGTPADGLQATLVYPQPRPLPPFRLDGLEGSIGPEALAGRWTLVFIGFTHCPDVCPTTLALLARVLASFDDAPAERRPQVLFVSVDPERDSPQRTAEYAHYFSPAILAATADHARLAPFTRSLGMVYMQTSLEGGGYTVDHSASLAVIDPQGRLTGLIRPPLDPDRIAADLRRLMGASG